MTDAGKKILVDRSRIQAYLDCPRLRYLRYHYLDENGIPRGIDRVEARLAQLNGSFVHTALELILTGLPLEEALEYAKGAYLQALPPHEEEVTARTIEQLFLLECLVRAWVKVRLPILLAEYEVVSIEEELQWHLDSQIIDMVRCDVVLRRKVDGLLFILEFKTVSSANEEWAKQWEHNSQVLANTKAIEELMGEPVGGMLIEGLVKGRLAKETAKTSPFFGQEIQQSMFCYAYTDGVNYSSTWIRGWDKVPVWLHFTPEQWVKEFTIEELATAFRPVEPIKPTPKNLHRWKRQTIAQEHRVAEDVKYIHLHLVDPEETERALDERFPKNDGNCFKYFGHPCPYEPLCFNGAIEADPVGSGLYRYRVPHHTEEVVET